MKHQRFRLSQGSNILVETFKGNAPPPVASKYDFDANRKYSVLFQGKEAGHCTVERDQLGVLWAIPDFEVAIGDVEFHPFWQVQGDTAMLTRILLEPSR